MSAHPLWALAPGVTLAPCPGQVVEANLSQFPDSQDLFLVV